ncbi:hypothetical protein DXD15_07775 [Blautia sp. TF11-31AT]|nr:hypothetical protein DXD15_07775 [Blautia sp. TF11-31AT]
MKKAKLLKAHLYHIMMYRVQQEISFDKFQYIHFSTIMEDKNKKIVAKSLFVKYSVNRRAGDILLVWLTP